MSNNVFFKHDLHCLDDPKLKRLVRKFHALGYAVYFRAVEVMYIHEGEPVRISELVLDIQDGLREPKMNRIEEALRFCVESELFIQQEDTLYSNRITANCREASELRKKKAHAGRIGNEVRWHSEGKNIADESQDYRSCDDSESQPNRRCDNFAIADESQVNRRTIFSAIAKNKNEEKNEKKEERRKSDKEEIRNKEQEKKQEQEFFLPRAIRGESSVPEDEASFSDFSLESDEEDGGDAGQKTEASCFTDAPLSPFSIVLNDGTYFTPTAEELDRFKAFYLAVDVEAQTRAAAAWSVSNPKLRKTRAGVRRFLNSWLAREQDSGGSGRRSPRRRGESSAIVEFEVLKEG